MAVAPKGEFIGVAGAWIVGGIIGAICCLVAFVLVPEVGLFGDSNSTPERVVGFVAGLACGPCFLAGPLLMGARRRDLSTLVLAGLVAVAVSVGVLVAAS
ncbi:MAG: hypothetical protein E4H05_10295 [Acidimicrobiales bacterium]|nr:MAG: hypothetical protein E4H05_10295 [Acidimicrobiales bacterium]